VRLLWGNALLLKQEVFYWPWRRRRYANLGGSGDKDDEVLLRYGNRGISLRSVHGCLGSFLCSTPRDLDRLAATCINCGPDQGLALHLWLWNWKTETEQVRSRKWFISCCRRDKPSCWRLFSAGLLIWDVFVGRFCPPVHTTAPTPRKSGHRSRLCRKYLLYESGEMPSALLIFLESAIFPRD